jgi:DNA/RNA-binding domain of Phe-tRNA-synthetase-like protein
MRDAMTRFSYTPEILTRFPDITAAVLLVSSAANGPTPSALADAFAAEQEAALRRIGDTPLSEIPSLAAWRRAFSAFGVKPTQYRSSAEALLRRLTKHGSIPSINLLVDLGNLLAVRYGLPVAVFDQEPVTGGTRVQFAVGGEQFTDIATGERSDPEPGEVVFVDDAGLVSARRWCWRQSAQSGAGSTTSEALVTIEALHRDAGAATSAALEDALALLAAHQPQAAITASLLSHQTPRFP